MSELEKIIKMIDNAVCFKLNWEERLDADIQAVKYLDSNPWLASDVLTYLRGLEDAVDQKKWLMDYCLDRLKNGKSVPEMVESVAEEFHSRYSGPLQLRAAELIRLYSYK